MPLQPIVRVARVALEDVCRTDIAHRLAHAIVTQSADYGPIAADRKLHAEEVTRLNVGGREFVELVCSVEARDLDLASKRTPNSVSSAIENYEASNPVDLTDLSLPRDRPEAWWGKVQELMYTDSGTPDVG